MDGITLASAVEVIKVLGWPGVLFVVWYLELKQRRRENEAHQKELADTLRQYREDVSELKRLYENNVVLVKNFSAHTDRLEKLYQETMGVVSLSTQTQADLVNAIKHNDFCPVVRGGAGK